MELRLTISSTVHARTALRQTEVTAHSGKEYTEKDLLKRLRRGESSAMSLFYDLYADFLAGVCSRYVTDADDAKDVLQESMVKIMYNIHRFNYRGEGSLRSWAARIAVNEALNLLRERSKAGFTTLDFDAPDEEDEPEPDVADVPPEVVHELIRQLPEGYRTVFNLYVIEGRSHREIGQMLGIGESSSASQFHRAKNRLARALKEYRKKHQD